MSMSSATDASSIDNRLTTPLSTNPPTSYSSHERTLNENSETRAIDGDVSGDVFDFSSSEKVPSPESSVSGMLKTAVDRALIFLGNASNETLGACAVGLGATTYLILGRVGLILIGAVGGVVLHATWETSTSNLGVGTVEGQTSRKGETGLQVALRLLQWRESRSGSSREKDEEASQIARHGKLGLIDFSEYPPETARAMNVLTDAVIRDYVDYWYSPIAPNDRLFPATSRQTYATFLLSLASNISRKRPADSFLEFVTNSSSIIIVLLNELATALSASPNSSPEDAVLAYLDMKPQSNLANLLDPAQQQQKLQNIANDILDTYLDPTVFACPPARVFLREILANSVLDMTLQNCSKSEWINDWIVYLLEEGEPELLNAIDAGVEGSTAPPANAQLSSNAESAAPSIKEQSNTGEHKRNVSRAEEAMDEAMREAQRLTQLIMEEDAKRTKEKEEKEREELEREKAKDGSAVSALDYASDSTNTLGIQTPTSSHSGSQLDQHERSMQSDISHINTTEVSADIVTPIQAKSDNPDIETIPTAEVPSSMRSEEVFEHIGAPEIFSLHRANILIFDDADPNDRKSLKTKPINDYMIQIEPSSSHFPGWMIARSYSDFETLHEVLRRISTISGIVVFTEAHSQLPNWRGKTAAQLTSDLERYLVDAVQFEALAESEGMKRFLEKSRGASKSPTNKNAFWASQAAIESVGKGMFDVMSKAPKSVAGGSKAVLGGVTSVLGGVQHASRKAVSSTMTPSITSTSTSDLTRPSLTTDERSVVRSPAASMDTSRTSVDSSTKAKPLSSPGTPMRSSSSFERIPPASATPPSLGQEMNATVRPATPSTPATPQLNLPTLPSDVPDVYEEPQEKPEQAQAEATTVDINTILNPPAAQSPVIPERTRRSKNNAPLSEQEATVTIELLFAVINELYTLSSAWNIRRTLLNAAKTYLLRSGNPQLENIRILLQDSVLEANTSDAGIAAHILKLRENSLPTEEEFKAWPAPPTPDEKEALRKKARKLLLEKGMPQALMSVMGAAASGEALGKVFDCLQVEPVARGLLFGMMLQALRALTQ